MRKKTHSWFIRITFAVIILGFIFFFGYSRMQKGGPGTNVAVRVNGEEIPYGLYRLELDNATEFYKKLFKDNIPENMREQVSTTALYQIINQTLLKQLAERLGISVSDLEIYNAISENPNFQEDGIFDSIKYKTTFLPYFEQRFGLNYERFLRNMILAEKARSFLLSQVNVTEKEARAKFEKDNTLWTFEKIKISLKDEYKKSTEEIAKEIHGYLSNSDNAGLNSSLKKYGLEKETIKEINIDKRFSLISGEGEADIFLKLFTLTPDNSLIDNPIQSGPNFYIFKLIDLKQPKESAWEEEKKEYMPTFEMQTKQEYLKDWQESMRKNAAIEEFVISSRK